MSIKNLKDLEIKALLSALKSLTLVVQQIGVKDGEFSEENLKDLPPIIGKVLSEVSLINTIASYVFREELKAENMLPPSHLEAVKKIYNDTLQDYNLENLSKTGMYPVTINSFCLLKSLIPMKDYEDEKATA